MWLQVPRKCDSSIRFTTQEISQCYAIIFKTSICMSDNCETCSDGKVFDEHFTNKVPEADEFKWYQCKDKDGFVKNNLIKGATNTALGDLKNQLLKFFWHCP